ncbi:MAG: hypothetical protein WCG82_02295, partial [Bacteroidota bacterium]
AGLKFAPFPVCQRTVIYYHLFKVIAECRLTKKLNKCRWEGKTQKCAKLMALGPVSGRLVGNKTINLDFWAPFFGSFFDFVELDPLKRFSVGRAKNEQEN